MAHIVATGEPMHIPALGVVVGDTPVEVPDDIAEDLARIDGLVACEAPTADEPEPAKDKERGK